jgi:hypothetical protein
MELQTQYNPVLGLASLATFGAVAPGGVAVLSGKNLREGLLASLWTAEILAGQAGLVPLFPIPGQGNGVAVLGAAREKIAHAPEAVRVIYLATHGAARQAQSHAQTSAPVSVAFRADAPVAAKQLSGTPIGDIGDFGASVVVLTVLVVAAIAGTAWFAKGTAEQIIQTRADDLRATYAADTAAKLAMAQIAAGQPVDPSVWATLKGVAARESRDNLIAPGLLLGGAAVGAGLIGWSIWKGKGAGAP